MEQQDPGSPFRRTWRRFLDLAESILNRLFLPGSDILSRIVVALFLIGLLAYGIRLWGVFYSWGNISFDFLDWAEVTGPRYAILRDAATRGILPLHVANTTALRGVTDRYFSIADTPFSPQYLLLPLMPTGRYLFLDTLLFYCIGFIGLLLIYRKYHLSPFTFLLLYLLFNFNGNLTSHLAVGHSIWTGTFLIPYFVLLVMHLVEQQRAGWSWILGFSTLMLVILLQGYFHLFIWCLIFMGVLGLFNWKLLKPVLLGGAFAVLLSLWRLLPPALALKGITQEYKGGFASVTDLFNGLVTLQDPYRAVHPLTDIFPLNAWEIDFYIGLLGLALILVFGVLLPLLKNHSKKSLQVQILIPSLILAALSIGQVYDRVFSLMRLPPFTGERVTSRILILPLMFVLILAVIFLQRELELRKIPAWGQLIALGGGYLIFHDLFQHMQAWRIRYLDAITTLFPKVAFNPAQHTLAIRSDPIYIGMLAGGAGVALLALVFLLLMVYRERRKMGNQNSVEVRDA